MSPHPTATLADTAHQYDELPAWLTLLLAAGCGLIVANLYYAQPLIGLITAKAPASRCAWPAGS